MNPGGHATFGALIKIEGRTAWEEAGYIGYGPHYSNNLAEYRGLIAVLAALLDLEVRDPTAVVIFGDSKLVIEQMNLRWRIRGGLYAEYADHAKELLVELRSRCSVTLRWVARDYNVEADFLSKTAVRL